MEQKSCPLRWARWLCLSARGFSPCRCGPSCGTWMPEGVCPSVSQGCVWACLRRAGPALVRAHAGNHEDHSPATSSYLPLGTNDRKLRVDSSAGSVSCHAGGQKPAVGVIRERPGARVGAESTSRAGQLPARGLCRCFSLPPTLALLLPGKEPRGCPGWASCLQAGTPQLAAPPAPPHPRQCSGH